MGDCAIRGRSTAARRRGAELRANAEESTRIKVPRRGTANDSHRSPFPTLMSADGASSPPDESRPGSVRPHAGRESAGGANTVDGRTRRSGMWFPTFEQRAQQAEPFDEEVDEQPHASDVLQIRVIQDP